MRIKCDKVMMWFCAALRKTSIVVVYMTVFVSVYAPYFEETESAWGQLEISLYLVTFNYIYNMEAELEKIPSQIGTAMLNASDGRIVKVCIFLCNSNK